jgi:hypothetical protein
MCPCYLTSNAENLKNFNTQHTGHAISIYFYIMSGMKTLSSVFKFFLPEASKTDQALPETESQSP